MQQCAHAALTERRLVTPRTRMRTFNRRCSNCRTLSMAARSFVLLPIVWLLTLALGVNRLSATTGRYAAL